VTTLSGRTRLYPVLGYPVSQVKAPGLLNPLLAEWGLSAVVVPVEVAPARLADVLRGLAATDNVDGVLVTVPHKADVCALAATVGPAAEVTGTANALRRGPRGWHADNFDGVGFVRGLAAAGHPVVARRAAVVGAGGAGSAVAASLLTAGAARVSVHDVDPVRRAALAARLAVRWPDRVAEGRAADLAAADLAVNATPLGMRPADPLPFDPAALRAGALIADIVMEPAHTPLLVAGRALGMDTHAGAHMLREQIPCYRDFFGWP